MNINLLLKIMVQNNASDIHIKGESPVFLRINGRLFPIKDSIISSAQVKELVLPLMNERLRKIFDEKFEVDFSYEVEGVGRFRFNYFLQRGKPALAIRYIPFKIPSFEELRLPTKPLEKLASSPRGLILVTGVTGSGKSTTLASIIEFINSNYDKRIITIEDPIEYVFNDKKSVISQREVGNDTTSFLEALRVALRQDPDVIMVGEMRDLETTKAAITAAETGHLVLSTMHTANSVQTISRIIDLYPPYQQTQIRLQLSEILRGIISQRLLTSSKAGRIVATEIMINTPLIKKLIVENNLDGITQAIAKGGYYGMQTFNQSLIEIYKNNMASLEEIVEAASNPDDVLLAIKGIEQDSGSGFQMEK